MLSWFRSGSRPDAVEIDAGFEFACARRSSGRVSCWGSDADGQLGDSATHSACGSGARCSGTPVDVVGITDAVDIVAGNNHACALHATGAVSCWGDNSLGQLGDGSFTDRATPVSVSGL